MHDFAIFSPKSFVTEWHEMEIGRDIPFLVTKPNNFIWEALIDSICFVLYHL